MKKLIVAVSAISTITLLSSTVSADMGDWVSKKPSQSQNTVQAEKAPQIEPAQRPQPATGVQTTQAEIQPLPNNPQQDHTRPQIPNHNIPNNGQAHQVPPKHPQQQQQQNNQVAQETANQERVARAMQSIMPNVVGILNTPSLSNAQKNYGFSYIAAMSQMLSDPKNMNASSIQQTYNTAVSCASRSGAGNVIGQLQSAFLSNPVLVENFKIAQGRGSFISIGQQAPGVSC